MAPGSALRADPAADRDRLARDHAARRGDEERDDAGDVGAEAPDGRVVDQERADLLLTVQVRLQRIGEDGPGTTVFAVAP